MSIFCKHEWKVLSEQVLPAPIEVLRDGRNRPFEAKVEAKGVVNPDFFKRTHVVIVACKKCPKIQKFVTK